jgi:hypothetical protein
MGKTWKNREGMRKAAKRSFYKQENIEDSDMDMEDGFDYDQEDIVSNKPGKYDAEGFFSYED